MIYINATLEAYNNGIVDYIICIGRKVNLADAMTKDVISAKLIEVMKKVKLHYKI